MTPAPSLGTQLRLLLAKLDGDVQSIYADRGETFRPRFFPVVQQLLNHGPMSVSAMAETVAVSQPAMTQTLTEMRRLGLIAQRPASDGRQRRVELTAKGRNSAERLRPIWQAVDTAAAELDSELPCGLSAVVAAALGALERESFKGRIKERLK